MELARYVILFIFLTGFSTLVWTLVGLTRFVVEKYRSTHKLHSLESDVRVSDVAVLIAAHNEAAVIEETLTAIARLIPRRQVYVVSDASSDHTGALSKHAGVNVLMLRRNRGKAGALVEGIRKFQLTQHYKVVLLLDADTRLDDDYFRSSLKLFSQKDVVAVAGSAQTLNDKGTDSISGRYLLAYRQRIYTIFQLLIKYGQAWRPINAVTIVPGFASMYRSEVLEKIDIDAPGFVIEDYNMTFEIHAKRLGRIAFRPSVAIAYTQDPDTMSDYVEQTKRWTLGFWQALARHQFRPTLFGWSVSFLAVESIISSALLIFGIIIVIVTAANEAYAIGLNIPVIFPNPYILLVAIFIQDYILTIITVIALKRPIYLIYGLGFVYMRLVEVGVNILVLYHFISRKRSNGRWKSPSRRLSTAGSVRIHKQ